MSCQLSVLSRFQDLTAVRRFLFPHLKDNSPKPAGEQQTPDGDAEEWGDDWGWSIDENTGASLSNPVQTNVEMVDDGVYKWLQNSIVSLSPNNDIIAVANDDKICVLTQKWDPQKKGEEIDTWLTTAWESSIAQDEGELITDILCLPLASQKRSTQGAPDWTCVIVGFTSGYVRMYTETGVLLLSQLLHLEPVQKLKCRTYEPPRFLGMGEKHEELIILYKKAVVSIDGFSLIQSLRACRNQVARATASGGEGYVQPPPLAYKKWALSDQDRITDLVSCGVTCPSPFDQLKRASMEHGFNAQPRVSPPAASLYITSGASPYVGFFYAIEGNMQPILSEVAMAMAHKLKSALMSAASGWLGFGGRQKDEAKEKPPKIEPAAPLNLKYGLPDLRRSGDSIVLSPCNNYIATTDSFGRVILIDVQKGLAVRMWKGYRDAQLGWVQVKEDGGGGHHHHHHHRHSPSQSRVAQFLIIYAPRRGIVEVWTAVHGPRVAAFNVSKYCMLVCPSYGLMGLNNVTYRGVRSRAFQCALIDPDGCVKTLDIPFHLALSDKSSKRARDLHLLKKLKTSLKEASKETESLKSAAKEIFLDIRIASISHQALERILATRYLSVNFMQDVVQACIAQLSAKGEDNLDIDSKMLLRYAHMQTGLLEMYDAIHTLSTQTPATGADVAAAQPSHSEMLQSSLAINKEEAAHISEQLEKFHSALESHKVVVVPSVSFADEPKCPPLLGVTSFLHCFSSRSHSALGAEDSGPLSKAAPPAICVSKEVTEERRHALAHLLFHACINGKCKAEEISVVLQKSNIAPDQLMKLLLLHCLSMEYLGPNAIPSLKALVRTITAMTDTSEVLVDGNRTSPWWQRVRDASSQSQQNCAAYITALVCRKVAADFIVSQTEAKDPDADTASDKEDDDEDKDKTDDGDTEKDNDTTTTTTSGGGGARGGGSPAVDLSSWEKVSVDLTHWELLLKQLEDTLALSTLLHLHVPSPTTTTTSVATTTTTTNNNDNGDNADAVRQQPAADRGEADSSSKEAVKVSVSKLLDGGKGSISEVVARFVASRCLGPQSLYKLPAEGEGQSQGQEGSVLSEEGEQAVLSMSKLERLQSILEDLRVRFPNSLDNDILISNCGWEYAVLWNKDPEEVHHLKSSVEYLKLVQNAVLRQGVSSMLWHMFVTKRMSAAAQLMEKVGKAPKDRLCRKETSMSDKSLTTFLGLTEELLNIIMEANCEANEVPMFNMEHNWQTVRGPASLGELAVDAKPTNYGLVRLHWHLATLMHAVMLFSMKNVKVLSLFDRKGKNAFFKDLHSHPLLPNKNIDDTLSMERRMVLARIVTHAIETLGAPVHHHYGRVVRTGGGGGPSGSSAQRRPNMFTFHWPRLCMDLALELNADEDHIRRHYVLELYNFGHDDLAVTILGFAEDQEKFGRQLLLVAGRRMAYRAIHENPKNTPRLLGEMSTGLSNWLSSMDMSKLQYKTSPLEDSSLLLHEAAKRLPDHSREYDVALELIDFTDLLVTLKISVEPQGGAVVVAQ
ncbi:rab3 GTPase-activating protein non-catalytic subunit-like [Babylonia areolata]|uniref:rab3 GTPase-activating protein non-catalytic subunit-like n=1 Tax=Babylonia areolata TaxID=304850 RepID=UPI003FCFB8D2